MSEFHTRAWFKENFGVDPLKLNIPFKTAPNPHYKNAAPMKLWREQDILPFKSTVGIEKHEEAVERGKKAVETRKTNLKEWFKTMKSSDPRVQEILKRLWEIGNEIEDLHSAKEECRQYACMHQKSFSCISATCETSFCCAFQPSHRSLKVSKSPLSRLSQES